MNQVQQFFEYLLSAVKIWVIVQPWESGIRVRAGKYKKILSGGLYFRIPYIDSVYIQENRLRVSAMPVQTLSSKDLKTVTLSGVVGFSLVDIEKLYETLYQPETTITNIAMSEVAKFVFDNDLIKITPKLIEIAALEGLKAKDYGLKFEYFKVTNFAAVTTFRLIQDTIWHNEGMEVDLKT